LRPAPAGPLEGVLAGPVFPIAPVPVGGFMLGSVALGFTVATTPFPANSPGIEVATVASPEARRLAVAGERGAGRLGAVGSLAAGVGAAVASLTRMRFVVMPGGASAARCAASISMRAWLSPISEAHRRWICWVFSAACIIRQRLMRSLPSANGTAVSFRPIRSSLATNASTLNSDIFTFTTYLKTITRSDDARSFNLSQRYCH
jgi:hypothetical protein